MNTVRQQDHFGPEFSSTRGPAFSLISRELLISHEILRDCQRQVSRQLVPGAITLSLAQRWLGSLARLSPQAEDAIRHISGQPTVDAAVLSGPLQLAKSFINQACSIAEAGATCDETLEQIAFASFVSAVAHLETESSDPATICRLGKQLSRIGVAYLNTCARELASDIAHMPAEVSVRLLSAAAEDIAAKGATSRYLYANGRQAMAELTGEARDEHATRGIVKEWCLSLARRAVDSRLTPDGLCPAVWDLMNRYILMGGGDPLPPPVRAADGVGWDIPDDVLQWPF